MKFIYIVLTSLLFINFFQNPNAEEPPMQINKHLNFLVDKDLIKFNYVHLSNVTIDIEHIGNSNKVVCSIIVSSGAEITVKLKGNPTTGYTQKVVVEPDDSIVKNVLLDPYYLPDPHDEMMVGYGGTYFFKFVAVGTGITSTTIEHARFFENPPVPILKTTIVFEVTDPSAIEKNDVEETGNESTKGAVKGNIGSTESMEIHTQ
ncbi:protease inhibitor I42 family protein [Cryptosporidium felis]|nr:protease inhibitor I42 family protein [Cryptosporidium felis]